MVNWYAERNSIVLPEPDLPIIRDVGDFARWFFLLFFIAFFISPEDLTCGGTPPDQS